MWEDDYIDKWRHCSSDREMRKIVSWAYEHYPNVSKPCKFNVGDIVRLHAGQARMQVLKIRTRESGNEIQAEYVSRIGRGYVASGKWRSENDYTHYNTNTNTEKETTEMNGKLYQTNEATPRFGTLLTTNSQGDLVLEMKGAAGAVEVFKANEVTVVTPFTFGVKFGGIGQEYSYLGKEGEVEVGDLLVLDESPRGELNVAKVTGVNTKSSNATKTFKGVKLVTKRIGD
jgi:hypothetical protein